MSNSKKFSNESSEGSNNSSSNNESAASDDSQSEQTILMPSSPLTTNDLKPIHYKLDSIANISKELADLYRKAMRANQLLEEENKRLSVELALSNERLNNTIPLTRSDNSLLSPIPSPTISHQSSGSFTCSSETSESGSPPDNTIILPAIKDIIFTTNNLTAMTVKPLIASSVKLISDEIYFIGETIIKLPKYGSGQSFSSYFLEVPELKKPYYKFIRNSKITSKHLILCLGYNDQEHTSSYVDCFFLKSGNIYPLESMFNDHIIDITHFNKGFLVSYVDEFGEYQVKKIEANFINENTIKYLGQTDSDLSSRYSFSYVSEFIYSHDDVVCFWFNGEEKSNKINKIKLSRQKAKYLQHDEKSEKIAFSKKQRNTISSYGNTDERVVDSIDNKILHKHKHHKKRKTSSINEDNEQSFDGRYSIVKADVNFLLKMAEALKLVQQNQVPNQQIKPVVSTVLKTPNKNKIVSKTVNPTLRNHLFIYKKNTDPEIINIPEQCGHAISVCPYNDEYFVLTSKSMLLRISGLHDDDPNCNFDELFVRPNIEYNKMYLCDINEYTQVEGFDRSMFFTTDDAVYRVTSWGEDDILKASRIYRLPDPNQKIIAIKPLFDSLTIFCSNYSIINIHYESYQFQTYTNIQARMFH